MALFKLVDAVKSFFSALLKGLNPTASALIFKSRERRLREAARHLGSAEYRLGVKIYQARCAHRRTLRNAAARAQRVNAEDNLTRRRHEKLPTSIPRLKAQILRELARQRTAIA